jgi:hypothetical protein
LLDNEVGAAVQMLGEFHNDIVVGVDEVPGAGDSALSVTDDAVGDLYVGRRQGLDVFPGGSGSGRTPCSVAGR